MNDPCKLSNFKSVVYSPLEVNLTLNWNSPIPAANISVLELNMGESQAAGSLKPPVSLVLSVWAQFFLLLCHSRENHPSIARFTSAVCISLVADYLRQCIACPLFSSAAWRSSFLSDIISRLDRQWYKTSAKAPSALISGPRTSKIVLEKGPPEFGGKVGHRTAL